MMNVSDMLDLETFPLDQPDSPAYTHLVDSCVADLEKDGMFNLVGFLKLPAAQKAVSEISPIMQSRSFNHQRKHNIYFQDSVPGLAADHPALALQETKNHTVCADQITTGVVVQVYEFAPLRRFLADTMGKASLYLMDDPLARANVMAYRDGEALNWHFDRAEFTTTLLLQASDKGGDFEYAVDLRTDDDPNYDGVARLLEGDNDRVSFLELSAGTLNVFKGKNTLHRVTPVQGDRERMISVFSYYENPGVMFSDEERLGFYGRTA
jgi:hypothetical protein